MTLCNSAAEAMKLLQWWRVGVSPAPPDARNQPSDKNTETLVETAREKKWLIRGRCPFVPPLYFVIVAQTLYRCWPYTHALLLERSLAISARLFFFVSIWPVRESLTFALAFFVISCRLPLAQLKRLSLILCDIFVTFSRSSEHPSNGRTCENKWIKGYKTI